MNDEILDQELSEWLDGELAPERVDALRERLTSDAALNARLAELASVNESLRALAPPAIPSDLRTRLQERIELESPAAVQPTTPRGRGMRWGAPLAAALAAGLVATWLWLPNSNLDATPMAVEPVPALEEASDDELAIAFEFETLRDLDLIRDLDLLEALLDVEGAKAHTNDDKNRG